MNLVPHIQELYRRHETELSHFNWTSEADRWAEFVFCLVHRCSTVDAQNARDAVHLLHAIGAIRVDALAVPEGQECPAGVVIAFVLRQHGFTEAEAESAVGSLRKAAAVIERAFGGKLQRFLRNHGEQMRDELVQMLSGIGVVERQLRMAISHWLQNALSIPISLESQVLLDACLATGATQQDLYNAVDALDINVAIVDDLIELDALTKAPQPVATQGV